MDAFVAIHHLSHTEISGQRAKHVGLIARQFGARTDVRHHLSHRLFNRVIEILIQPDRHQMVGGLGDARQILHSVTGFFGVLAEWRRAELLAAANDCAAPVERNDGEVRHDR